MKLQNLEPRSSDSSGRVNPIVRGIDRQTTSPRSYLFEQQRSSELESFGFMGQFYCGLMILVAIPVAIQKGLWPGIGIGIAGAVGIFVCSWLEKWFAKSRAARRTKTFEVDESGIRLPGEVSNIPWSTIQFIKWPINNNKSEIKLSPRSIGICRDPEEVGIKVSELKRDELPLLCYLIRKFAGHAEQTGWERFCFDRLFFWLDLPSDRSDLQFRLAFSKFHELGKHYVARKPKIEKQVEMNRKYEDGGALVWLNIMSGIDAVSWFLLGLSISFAAIFYSWLLTGGWVAPVINICLGFSVYMIAAGLVSLGLNRKKANSWFGPGTLTMLGVSVVITLVPGLMILLSWLGKGYSQLGFLIVFSSFMLPVYANLFRRLADQKWARNRFAKNAARFFNDYMSSSIG